VSSAPYDRGYVLRNLEWATAYWTGEREPTSTRNPKKCESCEYRGRCERSPLGSSVT